MRGFTPGDPRAKAAGHKGGKAGRAHTLSADYIAGYRAGARNARRHIDRWIQEHHDLIQKRLAATTPEDKRHADEEFHHLFRMFGAGRFDEWLAAHTDVVDDSMAANPEDGF